MRHEDAGKRLHDYVDGALVAEERAAVESHLAVCRACRTTVAELEALLAAVETLPREVRPGRDLWPDISRAIARGAARGRGLPRIIAIAAAAAAAILIVAWVVRTMAFTTPAVIEGPPEAGAPLAREPLEAALLEPLHALEAVCRGAEVELARSEAHAGRASVFDPEARIVDSAAVELQRAWAADPRSARLFRALARVYRARVDVRRRAAEYPRKPF